jgi:SAM-dependent methyltransferase
MITCVPYLDVGSGTGRLVEVLLERLPTARVVGLDTSEDMLRQAQRRLSERAGLIRAVLDPDANGDLPFPPCCFAAVVMSNVLHYLPNAVGVLAVVADVLQEGGQLVVEDYARRLLPFPWWLFEWLLSRLDPWHVHTYTLQGAVEHCQRAGLQVELAEAFAIGWLWHG